MDINVNLKITLEETPALINCLAAFSETLSSVKGLSGENTATAKLADFSTAQTVMAAPAAQTAVPVQPMANVMPAAAQPAAPTMPFAQPVAGAPAVPVAPARQYTLPEIQAACAPLMDQGKIAELQQIMAYFGVMSIMDIPEARYGELATKLRELGARL